MAQTTGLLKKDMRKVVREAYCGEQYEVLDSEGKLHHVIFKKSTRCQPKRSKGVKSRGREVTHKG